MRSSLLKVIVFIMQLAEAVISPKDDLAREMKEDKRKIRQKLDDLERQELEETAPVSEVADDGTLPMPEGEEEGEPAEDLEEVEESRIKKLRKKGKTEESKYTRTIFVSTSLFLSHGFEV